jgi:hypothetical protein
VFYCWYSLCIRTFTDSRISVVGAKHKWHSTAAGQARVLHARGHRSPDEWSRRCAGAPPPSCDRAVSTPLSDVQKQSRALDSLASVTLGTSRNEIMLLPPVPLLHATGLQRNVRLTLVSGRAERYYPWCRLRPARSVFRTAREHDCAEITSLWPVANTPARGTHGCD